MARIIKPIVEQEPEGFAEFWALWRPYQRSTDGRGKARPAYERLMLRGAMPQDIIDGAIWYLRNLKERDREYIPLAASWLNSERWADDCELERAYQARQANRSVEASKPVSAVKPKLPDNHFSRMWERGEVQGNA